MSAIQQSPNRKHFRSESEWRKIIQDYTQSGLTQEAFCQQAGIPKSSFYKWHRRLKTASSARDTAGFIDIRTLASVKKDKPTWDIELDLGNGVCLRLRGA